MVCPNQIRKTKHPLIIKYMCFFFIYINNMQFVCYKRKYFVVNRNTVTGHCNIYYVTVFFN